MAAASPAASVAGFVCPRLVSDATGEIRCMRIGSLLLAVWLLIGLAAAYQRDYFRDGDLSCASAGTVAVTVVAGPLNYLGANPRTTCPAVDLDLEVPQPSE